MALDEKALRREGFTEGVAIVLSDGQEWHLRRPELGDFAFRRDPSGTIRVQRGSTLGPNYETLLDAYLEAEDGLPSMVKLVEAAWFLLRLNYDLDDTALPQLFRMTVDDDPQAESNSEMWRTLSDAVMGRVPPPTPVG